eukprot:TRINITY_DN7191_c0_g1_i6.p2 TRINITY_DN7191_c0_g1~~TRINITY_DN7191_c0_g1_i6.p2  ORF type:complete len:128 (+),score=31.55 TRINITY_DN7191_c0_g1_i6:236-619(+)
MEIKNHIGTIDIPRMKDERKRRVLCEIGVIEVSEGFEKCANVVDDVTDKEELLDRRRKCMGNINLKELRAKIYHSKEPCNKKKEKILVSLEEISHKLKEIDERIDKIVVAKEVQSSKQKQVALIAQL